MKGFLRDEACGAIPHTDLIFTIAQYHLLLWTYTDLLTLYLITESAFHLTLVRSSLEFLPLVMEPSPPPDTEFHLDLSTLKVNS